MIFVSIVHDSIECTKCDGEGEYYDYNECKDIKCEECFGSGMLYDDWILLLDDDFVDLPEKMHYKTINLNQIELELA